MKTSYENSNIKLIGMQFPFTRNSVKNSCGNSKTELIGTTLSNIKNFPRNAGKNLTLEYQKITSYINPPNLNWITSKNTPNIKFIKMNTSSLTKESEKIDIPYMIPDTNMKKEKPIHLDVITISLSIIPLAYLHGLNLLQKNIVMRK